MDLPHHFPTVTLGLGIVALIDPTIPGSNPNLRLKTSIILPRTPRITGKKDIDTKVGFAIYP